MLTRTGAATALAITLPFEDLLSIGDQTRPDLFSLDIIKPEPLAKVTAGIPERIDATGEIIQPIDLEQARISLQRAISSGCQSLAICLLHSYKNPIHEQRLKKVAQELGFKEISISTEVVPLIEIVPRAQTTVLDAYLGPVVRGYLAEIIDQLGGECNARLDVMTSAGGLKRWDSFSGEDSILSGPAGGRRCAKWNREFFRRYIF